MSLDDALRWLREQQRPAEEDLASLVEINSFTGNVEGCAAAARRLREIAAVPGLSSREVPSPSGRFGPHLVFEGKAGGPKAALIGHIDTVFPPGTFEGYRRDGDLRRGPGVLDMKGGLVVVTLALRALAEGGLLDAVPLRLLVVSDEEVGSPEGRLLIEREAPPSPCALVFEAGRAGDAVITRRKGTGTATATALGKSAHAGNLHHEGVNAVWALSLFIDRAQRLTDYGEGRTVNVGRIEGGHVGNTVPDRAEALIDLRFTSSAQGDALLEALAAAARDAEAAVPGARVQVAGRLSRRPLERTEASADLYRRYAEAARAEGLGGGEAPLLGGGSDACTTSALGIPSIDGLGPRGKGFHTLDEQIEAATLLPKAAALARFLATLAAPLARAT